MTCSALCSELDSKASGNDDIHSLQDVTDLFGTDLPVEGGKGGEFAWRDGPLLAALKAGHWVVLDEVGITLLTLLQFCTLIL